MAGMYAVYHGPKGLKKIDVRDHGLTQVLHKGLENAGYEVFYQDYFDTLRIQSQGLTEPIRQLALKNEMNFRYFGDLSIGISLDETTTLADVETILGIFKG